MKHKKYLAYNPKEYWKKEIGFDVDKEFVIYQYLCGNLKAARKIKRIEEDKRFREYKSWRKHAEEIIRKCDAETLREFFHFLKLQDMECNIDVGMHTSMITPFFVALLGGELIQVVIQLGSAISDQMDFTPVLQVMSKGGIESALALIAAAILFCFFIGFTAILVTAVIFPFGFVWKRYIRSKYLTAFWRDYLDITKAVIEEKE